jgi:hypothetical protein
MPLSLSGDGSVGPLSATEVGYLDGVTSGVQAQINSNASAITTAGGLVLVAAQSFSAVSSVSVNNCFTATYESYVTNLTITSVSGDSTISGRLRASGVDDSTSNAYALLLLFASGNTANAVSVTQNSLNMASLDGTTTDYAMQMLLFGPQATRRTLGTQTSSNVDDAGVFYVRQGSFRHTQATSYDGLSILASGGTITGSLRIYGLRNSL